MGYALQGFNGYIPLTFTEINNYMIATKTELAPYEVLIIKRMSDAYVSESYNKNPLAQPPYVTKEMMTPKDNSQQILSAFQAFSKR